MKERLFHQHPGSLHVLPWFATILSRELTMGSYILHTTMSTTCAKGTSHCPAAISVLHGERVSHNSQKVVTQCLDAWWFETQFEKLMDLNWYVSHMAYFPPLDCIKLLCVGLLRKKNCQQTVISPLPKWSRSCFFLDTVQRLQCTCRF